MEAETRKMEKILAEIGFNHLLNDKLGELIENGVHFYMREKTIDTIIENYIDIRIEGILEDVAKMNYEDGERLRVNLAKQYAKGVKEHVAEHRAATKFTVKHNNTLEIYTKAIAKKLGADL